MDDDQQKKEEKKTRVVQVEPKLMKYAALRVRTGKSTPREAKLLVQSKLANNSNTPREGQEVVEMNTDTDWQQLFEEAEKLRQEDRADGLEVQKTLRIKIVMAGVVSTVIILASVAIVPLVVYNVAASTSILHTASIGFAVGGIVSVSAIASELSASFKRDANGTSAELKTLEKEYGTWKIKLKKSAKVFGTIVGSKYTSTSLILLAETWLGWSLKL